MTQGGAAQPIVVSTEAPDGGPALPVAVVSTPLYVGAGPPRKIVQVSDNRARVGGPAIPVYVVSGQAASNVQAGPPIPVYVVSGSLGQTYTQKLIAIAPANLIAYWPQGEASGTVMTDESGNGRNGAYKASGEPLLGQTGIGDGRTSALYDGTNDFANAYSASFAAAFSGPEGTAALWGRVSAAAVWTDAATRRLLSLRADANNRVLLEKSSTNNQVTGFYIAGGTSKSVVFTTSAPTTWFHFAITWSKSADQVKVYVGGAQVGATQTGLGTWAGALDSANTTCGATDMTGGNPWKGYEAHVAVWNTPLSAAQVLTAATV